MLYKIILQRVLTVSRGDYFDRVTNTSEIQQRIRSATRLFRWAKFCQGVEKKKAQGRANERYERNTWRTYVRRQAENIWPWRLARAYLLIPGKYWEFNQPVINTRI